MENLDVRIIVKASDVTYTQIAEWLHISRAYLYRCMGHPLKPEMRSRILAAVDALTMARGVACDS